MKLDYRADYCAGLHHVQRFARCLGVRLAQLSQQALGSSLERAIGELLATGRVLCLSTVEDVATLASNLAQAGIAAAPVDPPQAVDARALRQRLGLTREGAAARYGLEVETVRNWKAGHRYPDTTARSCLRAISNAPEHVEQAYVPAPKL